jgi:hypothetical protein
VRIDQMMSFAWKVLVPLVLVLILAQMILMKLPWPANFGWVGYLLILAANLGAVAVVLRVLGKHIRSEEVRTKRAFEPKSLIGVMAPVSPAGD